MVLVLLSLRLAQRYFELVEVGQEAAGHFFYLELCDLTSCGSLLAVS